MLVKVMTIRVGRNLTENVKKVLSEIFVEKDSNPRRRKVTFVTLDILPASGKLTECSWVKAEQAHYCFRKRAFHFLSLSECYESSLKFSWPLLPFVLLSLSWRAPEPKPMLILPLFASFLQVSQRCQTVLNLNDAVLPRVRRQRAGGGHLRRGPGRSNGSHAHVKLVSVY